MLDQSFVINAKGRITPWQRLLRQHVAHDSGPHSTKAIHWYLPGFARLPITVVCMRDVARKFEGFERPGFQTLINICRK